MVVRTGGPEAELGLMYGDHPNRSPWIAQLAEDGSPQPLGSDATADVVVVGAAHSREALAA